MTARRLVRLGLATALVAATLVAWLGYRRPELALWLGTALFVCG